MAHASSHYELLGVDQQASPEQVKAAYQKLVLTLHPDKAGEDSQERFQQLQQAWQTLRDPSSRLLYDHQLTQAELRATVVLHDEVELSDMEPGSPTNGPASCQQCTYPCRCGDSYVLTPADMRLAAHTQQIILPCRSAGNSLAALIATAGPPPNDRHTAFCHTAAAANVPQQSLGSALHAVISGAV